MRKIHGVVVSDKMKKTVVVAVTQWKRDPKYQKTYRKVARFKAHDEEQAYHVGDEVVIEATRPLSREKRWRVVGKIKDEKEKIKNNEGAESAQ